MILRHRLSSAKSVQKNTISHQNPSANPAKLLTKTAFPAPHKSLPSVPNVYKPTISTKTQHAPNVHKIAKHVVVQTIVIFAQKAIIWYKAKNNILVAV